MQNTNIIFEKTFGMGELDTIAQLIIQSFPDSKVFTFTGDLGAGKTTLIKSLCRNLSYHGDITSPTFSIINEYTSSDLTIYHMDLYRIQQEEELIQLGFEDYLFSGHYCFIEWPQIARSFFDDSVQHLYLKSTGNDTRKILATHLQPL
jgi:tRNA threonylcarbamoyladenosine biosynthesis protein TsaE